jgi:hypothetical protein
MLERVGTWLKAKTTDAVGSYLGQRIFTKLFFASLAGSLVGAIIASMPLFWSAMQLDLNPTAGSGQLYVPLYFGILSYDYANLVALLGEALLLGIALGVSGTINWFESRLDGKPLGKLSAFFAGASVVGSLMALALFIGVSRAGVAPDQINEDFVKYVSSAYTITLGLVIFYFSSILQVRRVKDLGLLADG